MSDAGARPFAAPLPQARALPWVSVAAGSLMTALPLVVTAPLMPPIGLLMLLAWRLLARYSLRRWAAAPLGFFDDLVSGQPLGSAVLLWSLCFLLIELIEQRMVFRDFWQDWLIASGGILFCLLGGRFLAAPLHSAVDAPVAVQAIATILLFPLATRLAVRIEARRGRA